MEEISDETILKYHILNGSETMFASLTKNALKVEAIMNR